MGGIVSETGITKDEMKKAAERLAAASLSERRPAKESSIQYVSRAEAHPDKKYDSITIQLSNNLKRRFLAACSEEERTPSSVGERLIADYIRNKEKDRQANETPEWHR